MKSYDAKRLSDDEAIEATAAAWLAERDDGLAPERESDFVRWRAANPRHAAAIVRLEGAWAALQQLRDFRPEARVHPDRDLLRASPARRRMIPFPAIAMAALAASLVLGAAWWFAGAPRGTGLTEQRYATTTDGYERVALEDGSLLELNSNTEVRVQCTSAKRRVRLVRGEAHFTVAKDNVRPFSVEAGAVAVRAVGTAFNVRLGVSDVEVLVTEGQVEENESGGPALAAGPHPSHSSLPASGSPTFLNANERAVIPSVRPMASAAVVTTPIIEKVAPDAVREALAWQGPRLVFLDTALADAVAQFNRRNQVQLVVADAELGTLPIGGSFRAENVEAFVRLLASGGDIAVERPDATRIVLRKAK